MISSPHGNFSRRVKNQYRVTQRFPSELLITAAAKLFYTKKVIAIDS